jgi:hypothetical protein
MEILKTYFIVFLFDLYKILFIKCYITFCILKCFINEKKGKKCLLDKPR